MAQGLLQQLDNAKVGKFHLRAWVISGMGFFTDAYDLFIIGTVVSLLPLAGWTSLSTADISLISSVALLASVIGAFTFGRLLDLLGRSRVYGFELMLLITGAVGSAFLVPVNGVAYLLAWRFILGLGIGGDYAGSSTIMAEFSNAKNRGQLIGMVFSMQGFGLVFGPVVALIMLRYIPDIDVVWRLLLFLGAIPAAIVLYGRRTIGETPRYSINVSGDVSSAKKAIQKISGNARVQVSPDELIEEHISWKKMFTDKYFLMTLMGTAGAWFALDWAFYGNSIMSHQMLSAIVPASIAGVAKVRMTTLYSLIIFAVSALPGYWIATFTVDRIGRKPMQIIGFLMMAISYIILSVFRFISAPSYIIWFMAIYGMSYFFTEFGPNVTTFIYGPEMFPTSLRGLGSGLSSAGGKLGAFIGTALNVIIFALFGESILFIMLALISFLGALLTIFFLPETSGRSLEDISGERNYKRAIGSGSKK
ncbi:MFS transporter [Thermoplasma sp.]|uniref:MFS transporter n=1 Tax=Thermoplasma sp. TaxID=1973142 RepID=UPI001272CC20|nr:MFS transporter [Thermoplasma sp.]KAA8922375.1 MAG: MFS transporter [Thermoplasma sp.]